MMRDERLLLVAQEPAELPVISALLQDATLRLPDIAWDRRARRLVCLVNRFRWEAATPTRVRAALRVDHALAAQRAHWPAGDVVLDLLALRLDGLALRFDFAAGASIRLHLECVDITLEDISGPWGVARVPAHA